MARIEQIGDLLEVGYSSSPNLSTHVWQVPYRQYLNRRAEGKILSIQRDRRSEFHRSTTLTHFHQKAKTDPLLPNPHFLSASLFRTFVSLLAPLEDALGPWLFQFEYLNRDKMATQRGFQEQLGYFREQLCSAHQYGVEVRNGQYLNRSYFEFLAENRLSPVLLDGYWMPPVTEVYRQWRSLVADHDFVVIRLLGPDRKGIETRTAKRWDQIVWPRDEQLRGIAEMVEDLLEGGTDVYVNVNNHYEGSAPLTIQRLEHLLGA